MELNIFNQLSNTTIKELLVKGFIEKPNYRYGFQVASRFMCKWKVHSIILS